MQKETRGYNNSSRHRRCDDMLSQNVKERNYEHIATLGGLLPNAFSRFFTHCKCEKIIVISFLKNAMSNFIPSDSSVFAFCHVSCFYGESSRPERTANMRINRRYCKFFGKNWCSFFEEDENRCFCNALIPEFIGFLWWYVAIINVSLRNVAVVCSFCRYIANTLLVFHSEFCRLSSSLCRWCQVSRIRAERAFMKKKKQDSR